MLQAQGMTLRAQSLQPDALGRQTQDIGTPVQMLARQTLLNNSTLYALMLLQEDDKRGLGTF